MKLIVGCFLFFCISSCLFGADTYTQIQKFDVRGSYPELSQGLIVATYFVGQQDGVLPENFKGHHAPLESIRKTGLTSTFSYTVDKRHIVYFRPYCVIHSKRSFVCKVFPEDQSNKYERFFSEYSLRFIELPGIYVARALPQELIFPTYQWNESLRCAQYVLNEKDIQDGLIRYRERMYKK